MAHYAKLDENNVVTQVFVGKDEGEDGIDWELYYNAKRTSYNTRQGIYYDPVTKLPAEDQSKAFRKNFAGVGYTYNEELDAFITPKQYPSWILNEESGTWMPPILPPTQEPQRWSWDEETISWIDNYIQ
jgi:hypothetical protein